MLNLSVLLESTARAHPDRTAVVSGEQTISYAELDRKARQLAEAVRARGVRPGDRVALICPNLPEFPVVYFGLLKAGAVVVPLNPLLKERELEFIFGDSGAVAVFAWEGSEQLPVLDTARRAAAAAPGTPEVIALGELADLLAPHPGTAATEPTGAEDPAVIIYTSGTTGTPKGATLSHVSLLLNARMKELLIPKHDHDVVLVALPLYHIFGQTSVLNGNIHGGATLVLLPRFDPGTALDLLIEHRVTLFSGVPSMFQAFLQVDPDGVRLRKAAETVRLITSGGAPLPVAVFERFDRLCGLQIRQGYGLSETSPTVTFCPWDEPIRPASVGKPVWGVDIQVFDHQDQPVPAGTVGEIVIRGHCLMLGYFNRPEATAEAIRDGWFHTGDLGRFDEDGWLYVVDRLKDLILRGGYNVYPAEVEQVLLQHPSVAMTAVVGQPHERLGQEVVAYVVPRTGHEVDVEELSAFARERLAEYKYPRRIIVQDELPMTSTGKILKRALP
ncbi:long-chain fatty acid--CoA ligase [Amycolatopsis acidiphila]|uniref:Long-chain fatty acid--CoA ligase n=1 Tax=Amycolatopsis acidiphila TaxID=715473 RepID=A0A558AAL1_9PSEU|nr:long-chain fatty acid--CoA ligase [Amycolatopsis acidiphila]TVT21301.1 long-chain fatty acid--CoA ligase [Amycolatopsis acidiphila]UIJ63514.1 long-chain fatty acid--CoA ligase [Amycolatopsis acidiphila]GHG68504.1 long-chain-fatty-acid--CoA ligase [Amycolatopsis acidiphila]